MVFILKIFAKVNGICGQSGRFMGRFKQSKVDDHGLNWTICEVNYLTQNDDTTMFRTCMYNVI